LVKDGRILLVKEAAGANRRWSLPGGAVEHGEALTNCLVREFLEETRLPIKVGRLLYLAERFERGNTVVHVTFEVSPASEALTALEHITDAQWIPVSRLTSLGFGSVFPRLLARHFPNSGQYIGSVSNIGLR
jgi:8-oxo-dGTP diphosphatase